MRVLIQDEKSSTKHEARKVDPRRCYVHITDSSGRVKTKDEVLEWKCPKCGEMVGPEVDFQCECGKVCEVS